MLVLKRTAEFAEWLRGLDSNARAKVLVRVERLNKGNPGDVAPVGDAVSEMRIHSGPGLSGLFQATRRYHHASLCGDKGSQDSDIRRAYRKRLGGVAMAKAQRFDAAEFLDDPETIAAYLTEALRTGDTDYILQAIGTVARAEGMTSIAQTAGLNRESLYRALDTGGNPQLDTIVKVLDALGVQLAATPKPAKKRAKKRALEHA